MRRVTIEVRFNAVDDATEDQLTVFAQHIEEKVKDMNSPLVDSTLVAELTEIDE